MSNDQTADVTAANDDPTDSIAAPGAPSPVDHSGPADRAAGGTRTRAGSDYGDYVPDKDATTVYIEAGLAAAAQRSAEVVKSDREPGSPTEQTHEDKQAPGKS